MIDFEARQVIEALRSGIPSRAVGHYFSSARPKIMSEIAEILDTATQNRKPGGMIIAGKYGEGKTHLLNTVFNMAHERNMVVSLVSLSKETPFDKLYLIWEVQPLGTCHREYRMAFRAAVGLSFLDVRPCRRYYYQSSQCED